MLSPGQAPSQSGHATDPALTLEAPIPSGPPATLPATTLPLSASQDELRKTSAPNTPNPSCSTQTPPCVITPVAAFQEMMVASDVDQNVFPLLLQELANELCMFREEYSREIANLTTSVTSLGAAVLSVLAQQPTQTTVVGSPSMSSLTVSPATPHVSCSCGVSGPTSTSQEESTGADDRHIVKEEIVDDQ